MNDNPMLPKIEITGGQGERIDPGPLQFIFAAAQAAQAAKLRKLEESKIPIGRRSLSLSLTDEITEVKLHMPAKSYSIINDDATDDIYIVENDPSKLLTSAPIKAKGEQHVNHEFPIVHAFYLKAASGVTAAVRLFWEECLPMR